MIKNQEEIIKKYLPENTPKIVYLEREAFEDKLLNLNFLVKAFGIKEVQGHADVDSNTILLPENASLETLLHEIRHFMVENARLFIPNIITSQKLLEEIVRRFYNEWKKEDQEIREWVKQELPKVVY